MNYITLIITIISIVTILLGGLLGWIRGFKRTVVLIGLVLVAWLISWLLCPAFERLLANSGVMEEIQASLSADEIPATLVAFILNTIIIMIEVVVFTATFSGLMVFMYFVAFNIIKIFVKKEEDEPRSKGNIIGSIALGALSGLIVVYTMFVPITGVAREVGKLGKAKIDGEELIQFEKAYDVEGYLKSPFGFIYDKTGGWLFNHVATSKDLSTGEKVNLSDNVEVVVVATQILDEAVKISQADFSEGLTQENVNILVESLTKMDEAKDSLSDRATDIFNEILIDMSSSMGEDLPLSVPEDFDFSKVNFKEAADAIEVIYDYTQSEEPELTEEQVGTIVTAFTENMVIIEALEGQTLVELDETSKGFVEEKLSEVMAEDKLTQDQMQLIKGLLGMAND